MSQVCKVGPDFGARELLNDVDSSQSRLFMPFKLNLYLTTTATVVV